MEADVIRAEIRDGEARQSRKHPTSSEAELEIRDFPMPHDAPAR